MLEDSSSRTLVVQRALNAYLRFSMNVIIEGPEEFVFSREKELLRNFTVNKVDKNITSTKYLF